MLISVALQAPVTALNVLAAAVHAFGAGRLMFPTGGATVAVLTRSPVAAALITVVTV